MSYNMNNKSEFVEIPKLHKADEPWKPSFKVSPNRECHSSLLVEEKIKRNVLSTLNKLTPQKFGVLLEQLKKLEIDTLTKLELIVNLIHQKAVYEPLYSATYAKMCKYLSMVQVPIDNTACVNFHKLLLTKCQNEFECDSCEKIRENRLKVSSTSDPIKKKELQQQIYIEEKRIKGRRLGNIKLLGELFKLHIVTEHTVKECIKRLFSKGDDESLECMCVLLKVTGKELEKIELQNSKKMMDSYVEQMQAIIDMPFTCSRIRFMLQDVIDLRKNNWVPRRAEEKPKTIEEIHQEIILEQYCSSELCGS